MRPFKSQLESALLRGIAAAAELDGADRQKPILIIEEIQSHDWASVTFVGARHSFTLRLDGHEDGVDEALQALALRLPDWEFRISGHIVADVEMAEATCAESEAACAMPASINRAHDDATHRSRGEVGNVGPSTVSHSFVINILTIID